MSYAAQSYRVVHGVYRYCFIIYIIYIIYIIHGIYRYCSVDTHNTLAHLEVYVAIITSYRIVFAVPVELQRWTSIKPTLFQLVEVFSMLRRQFLAKIIEKLVGFGFLIWPYDVCP